MSVFTRMKAHRDDKKKKDAGDILEYVTLLDSNMVTIIKFIAFTLLRVGQLNSSLVDLCFLLKLVEEMRKKMDEFIKIQK